VLSNGATGRQVELLQRALGIAVDGIYGGAGERSMTARSPESALDKLKTMAPVNGWCWAAVDRFFGVKPGRNASYLEQLLWARRARLRTLGLVFIMLLVSVGLLAAGGAFFWLFFVAGIFLVTLFSTARVSVLIWRERRG
jgi:hypothetical protein